MRRASWLILLAAILAPIATAWGEGEYLRKDLLIETEEAAKLLTAPNVRILDAADGPTYARAHIPGAVNVFYLAVANLEARKKNGYPVSPQEAEKIFGGAGIDEKTQVIVYDGGEGPFASGLWFVLEFFGHKNVKVLNGGFRKWVKEGRAVTQDEPKAEKKKFVARPNTDTVVTLDWMKKNLRNQDLLILDARSFREYIGEDLRPGASRGGHIPGAIHFEWTRVADKVATFKPGDQLKKALEQRGITKEKEVVAYCHTGIGRASDLALALKLIGYDKARLYTGSWEEWSSDPRLPIEK
jgi:thiosulfate/3-mercaptopyruvate sulfurtransferase